MVRYLVVLAFACALLFGASVAYAQLNDDHDASGHVNAASEFDPVTSWVTRIAIDAVPESTPANLPTTYGSVEDCREVAVGDEFNIDIVIDANSPPRGIFSTTYYLVFDPDLLSFVNVDHDLLLGSTPGSVIDLSRMIEPGIFLGGAIHAPAPLPNTGGALARITLQAIAPGNAQLTLDFPEVTDTIEVLNGPDTSYEFAHIAIDDSCANPGQTPPPVTPGGITATPTAPNTEPSDASETQTATTPTPTATPTPTPTPTASPSPARTVGAATFTPTATPIPQRAPGDADCNGHLDEMDVLNILLGITAGGAPQSACQTASNNSTGDYDCSNAIDQFDVLYLLMHLAGLSPPTTC